MKIYKQTVVACLNRVYYYSGLLQKLTRRSHIMVAHKALLHPVFEHRVARRHHAHPNMVGHIAACNRNAVAHPLAGKVGRFEKAVPAIHS